MDNKELMGWMSMRTWHIFAVLVPFFALFAPLVIYVGSVNSDFDVPLMIMSVAFSIMTLMMTLSGIMDMKVLAGEMTPEMAESKWGQTFKGFAAFAAVFTVLILSVPVAHWIALMG